MSAVYLETENITMAEDPVIKSIVTLSKRKLEAPPAAPVAAAKVPPPSQIPCCCINDKNELFKVVYNTEDDFDLDKFISEKDLDVNVTNSRGEAPLHLAVRSNKIKHVKTLLKHGAKPNVPDKTDRIPLMVASSTGHAEIIDVLINHGANVNVTTSRTETSLMFAVCANMIDAVNILLKHKADPNINSCNQMSPLILAVRNTNQAIVKVLVEYGASLEYTDEYGCTAIHYAARSCNTANLKILIDAKADMDVLDHHGDAPFVASIRHNRWKALRALIEAGCDVTNMDGLNASALGLATLYNFVDCIRVLVDNGEDIDEYTYFGNTPLMLAAFQGYVETAQLYLEHGGDPNIMNRQGLNALHKALLMMNVNCEKSRHRVVKMLLKYGANPSTKVIGVGLGCPQLMSGSACPMSLAIGTGYISLVRMLLYAGHDVGQRDLLEWKTQSLANNVSHPFYASPEMTTPILKWICQPRSLLFCSRAKVRQLLKPSIPQSIEKLEIAVNLRDYLNFSDIDEIQLEPISILEETINAFPTNFACSIRALKKRLGDFVNPGRCKDM